MQARNYGEISPSAHNLLRLKARTDIPFAREAAGLLLATGKGSEPGTMENSFAHWAGVFHFEERYRSIDQLLKDVQAKNILELSSGFSFRGLAYCLERDIHYVDSDLPGVIDSKKALLADLNPSAPLRGKLELLPLNALDGPALQKIARRFAPGELALVNEGLLMYLDDQEKKELAHHIRDLLIARGGCWITADIYIRRDMPVANINIRDKDKEFFEKHRVREKMFESRDSALRFISEAGFKLEKEALVDPVSMSSFPALWAIATEEQRTLLKNSERLRWTWQLKAA